MTSFYSPCRCPEFNPTLSGQRVHKEDWCLDAELRGTLGHIWPGAKMLTEDKAVMVRSKRYSESPTHARDQLISLKNEELADLRRRIKELEIDIATARAELFCNENCTWLDHHVDCSLVANKAGGDPESRRKEVSTGPGTGQGVRPRYERVYAVLRSAKRDLGLSDNGLKALLRLYETGNTPLTLEEMQSPHSGWTNTLGVLHDDRLFERHFSSRGQPPTRRSFLTLSESGRKAAESLIRRLDQALEGEPHDG